MSASILGKRHSKVKAFITAAGMGKRFGALTKKTNKCLLKVDGKPLIRHITDQFRNVGMKSIGIATGYDNQKVVLGAGGRITELFNPFYQVAGILGSFWAARNWLYGSPYIFTTSDHFFGKNVLHSCLNGSGEIRLVVQKKKSYTKEDAKVIIHGQNVVSLGKGLNPLRAHGEFAGMVYFGPRISKLFFDELKVHFETKGPQGYMMDILMRISSRHTIPLKYVLCEESSRTEVDSVHDLVIARKIAKRFKKGNK